jgi:hypothetical protein
MKNNTAAAKEDLPHRRHARSDPNSALWVTDSCDTPGMTRGCEKDLHQHTQMVKEMQ